MTSTVQSRPSPPIRLLQNSVRQLDGKVPPLLKPLLRAYVLGYATTVAPRVLTLLLQCIISRRKDNTKQQRERRPFFSSLLQILRKGFELQRFPAFCAALVGGSTFLQVPVQRLLARTFGSLSETTLLRLSRWISTFVAAWLSFRLLQSKKSPHFTQTVVTKSGPEGQDSEPKQVHYAGRTLDLSFFAIVRAVDVLIGTLWGQTKRRLGSGTKSSKFDKPIGLVSKFTDPAIFAASCALIMWSWVYHPERLPAAYNKWITSAAAVDPRLVTALQRMRTGEMSYGSSSSTPLLEPMCVEYGLPASLGDPAKTIPFPCELVHMGCGPSCEGHAMSRFARSFRWAMATYLPLTLALQLRKREGMTVKGVRGAVTSSLRSSAFLGSCIALFYYGVCLARTRVGPFVLGKGREARNWIDGGFCVGCGCGLCGWSILIEKAGRQKDIALFVAPRALATLVPRRYGLGVEWRETLAFSVSTAVVFGAVVEDRAAVRGVLGKVLGKVLLG